MGAGGSPPIQNDVYPDYVTKLHSKLIAGVRDDGVGGVFNTAMDALVPNLVHALNYAITRNPYDGRTPYDPTTDVGNAESALTAFTTEAQGLLPSDDVQGFMGDAAAKYDSTVSSAAKIAALVTAHDNATATAYERRVSGGNVGMWMQGAFMTTQFASAGMQAAGDRANELAELRAKLDIQNLTMRVTTIADMARMMVQERLASVQSKQAAFTANFEFTKLKVAAFEDYQDRLVDYGAKRTMWEFNLVHDGQPVLMSITGAPLTPRALTKSEQRMAAIGTALNTALQFGGATNPAMGAFAGLASLAVQSLGSN